MGKIIFTSLIIILLYIPTLGQEVFKQTGKASYYADKFEGKLTASGDKYKHNKFTAAHRTLPFGTRIKVTNLQNQNSVIVKINDRGPYVKGRILDLSRSAAEKLDFIHKGLTEVTIEVVDAVQMKKSAYDPGRPMRINKEIDQDEFYEFNVKRYQPSGFGVQIGSFRELVNLIRLSENLKKSYKKEVTVEVSFLNNVKVYKIIVGREKTRKKAEKLRDKLRKKYPESFIVDFGRL